MAVFYTEGEIKKRPGIYQRHINTGYVTAPGGTDGICAIPVKASWGPLGEVVKNTRKSDLDKHYGKGIYGEGFTVPAAAAMFDGGATVVYTYRMGTGGTAATAEMADSASTGAVTITAKCPGSRAFTFTVRTKLGDTTHKELIIYDGSVIVESYTFAAGGDEAAALVEAAKASENFTFAKAEGYTGDGVLAAAANTAFTAGADPVVTNEDYSAAFAALEPYYYNTIALDVDDDENMTLSLLLQAYLESAYKLGKLGIAVVGEKTSVAFETRCVHSKAFNDYKVVYLGNGWKNAAGEAVEGAMAICYTAGVIASTPSNQGITHKVIDGATDMLTSLTFAQYESAIDNGMLLVSMSPDGAIWYDSGINALTNGEDEELDIGWKKIRRVKVRFEIKDRLDRALAPKVGRVTCDTDGVADIIQAGQRVLDTMVAEGKLMPGASFVEDSENPHEGDSAWFIIAADDLDSLEKIYLQYQFRYSQYA